MQTEYIKFYILLVIIAIGLYILTETKAKDAKANRKKNLVYAFCLALIIGLIPMLGLLGLRNFTLLFFILIQVLVLIVGVFNVRFLFKYVPWLLSMNSGLHFIYHLSMLSLSAMFMLFVLDLFHLTAYPLIILSGLLWFLVPLFYSLSWKAYSSMPKKQFKVWTYPLQDAIAPPSDEEMTSLVVISFEFQKTIKETGKTVFRAKAPLLMPLGRLFYYFINDYNDRHQDTPIEYTQSGDIACHWLFYIKPRWYQKVKYIDFDSAIKDNGIKENSVIVCERVNAS